MRVSLAHLMVLSAKRSVEYWRRYEFITVSPLSFPLRTMQFQPLQYGVIHNEAFTNYVEYFRDHLSVNWDYLIISHMTDKQCDLGLVLITQGLIGSVNANYMQSRHSKLSLINVIHV